MIKTTTKFYVGKSSEHQDEKMTAGDVLKVLADATEFVVSQPDDAKFEHYSILVEKLVPDAR